MDIKRILTEQQEYYRARAHEYDEWWERRGRYDRGPELNRKWFDEIAEVRSVFNSLDFHGEVVELATGTGYWTHLLSHRALTVTALDGSSEMLAIAQTRLGADARNVEFRCEDLFNWRPERQWDAILFCFWISHVPVSHLIPFMRTCGSALRSAGLLFMLDGQRVESSTAADHVLPDLGEETMIRRLNDGREFEIVKNFHQPIELVDAARAAGIELDVHNTSTFFQYATGVKS